MSAAVPRSSWKRCLRVGLVALLAMAAPAADALDFDHVTVKKTGMPVLYIHDKKDENGRHLEGFVEGDAAKLRKAFARGGFREVWLDSGGGNLEEGMAMGRLLHEKKAFVRVPDGASCVSSCTVAFLGGVIRVVDPRATYKVHMYSAYSKDEVVDRYWGLCRGEVGALTALFSRYPDLPPEKLVPKLLRGLAEDPDEFVPDLWNACGDPSRLEQALRATARKSARSNGRMGVRLFHYFQEMRGGRMDGYVRNSVAALDAPDVYALGRNAAEDAKAIQAEGKVALQRLLMDYEMAAVQEAHKALASRSDLGSQATPALAYLDRMLSARILHTQTLSQPQLETLNYNNLVKE